ncbi:MAG: hypothetical protein IBJ11_06125 [Phycisphaerales bacterium]|nr:hypothetical protein [Phycisphaerales bacterium]
MVDQAIGWPFRAAVARTSIALSGPTWRVDSGIRIPDEWTSPRLMGKSWYLEGMPFVFPLEPIWGGLLANLAIYVAPIVVALETARALRRRRRVRRRRCPACAYPMGPSRVCTECGEPLPDAPKAA